MIPTHRTSEPALSAGRAERLLLGGELARRREHLGRGRRSAEEVDPGLADQPAAELDVARTVARLYGDIAKFNAATNHLLASLATPAPDRRNRATDGRIDDARN